MWKLFGYALLFALVATIAQPAQAQLLGTGWTAEFYEDTAMDSATGYDYEPYPNGVYFNWGTGVPTKADHVTPVPGVGPDYFSARFWSRQPLDQIGTYLFTVYVDDGVRVYLDGILILDEFTENHTNSYRTFQFYRHNSTPTEVNITIEYVEYTGSALLVFQWGLLDKPTSAIPTYSPIDNGIVSGDLSPAFVWADVDVPSYIFSLWADNGTRFWKSAYPSGAICNGSTCTVDIGALPRTAALILTNGRYSWRVATQGMIYTLKSKRTFFTVDYPGKPLSLSPDFYTIIAETSPVLRWGDVEEADEYKIVLTRVKTGEKTKIKWMADEALGCDAVWCTLDLGALEPRVALKRGQYTWRVFARNLTFRMSVSKSNPAALRIKPETRTLPLPAPEAVDGFRAP
jgi:hypothetical protein